MILSLLFSLTLSAHGQNEELRYIKLATTTSTENSGLLAELIPAFEESTGIIVDVIALGIGIAIADYESSFVSRGYDSGTHSKESPSSPSLNLSSFPLKLFIFRTIGYA